MTKLEDCFERGLLHTVLPSDEKAKASINAARENLIEAEEAVRNRILRAATNSAYLAVFHAARAILYRDGIREKSHFCIEQYLTTYVTSGELEEKWVAVFGSIRSKRDINQYHFNPPGTVDEIGATLLLAGGFIDRMEKLLEKRRPA